MQCKGYPSGVSDEEWAFVALDLRLIDPESAGHTGYDGAKRKKAAKCI